MTRFFTLRLRESETMVLAATPLVVLKDEVAVSFLGGISLVEFD